MSTPSIPQGKYISLLPTRDDSLHTDYNPEFNDMFDFDNLGGKAEPMFSPHDFSAASFATVNDPLTGQPPGTVSPKDLMGDSAPPSTSFTDLSTPSFDSPGYFSQDTSPLFAADAELGPGHESWDSLFPVNDAFSNSNLDEANLLTTSSKLSKDVPPSSPMIRNGSSPGQSPSVSRGSGSGSGRQSSVSGVNSRRREKPLKPLNYDATDPVAVKRARNTEAARKSRARKVERQDQMERRIADLEKSLEEAMEREAYWKARAETK